ncbi:YrzI family small protein [Fictibacillus phosphorivorans]|uniref:YrzI family small protein n=1 Tax=Fictibacillus phosphorivorans TaxID=1221500 RepID=UPI0009EE99A4|nr:YrzI family small protein [Fictibacillus phosphorivorans]MQR95474.1 YrzI family small protein [Fictibacillus phosphorivorans]
MFTLHLFFVTITFSIKRNHRSDELYARDMEIKTLYDRAKEKASCNMSSWL